MTTHDSPSPMPTWLMVRVDGTAEYRHGSQREVHSHLGGPVTFLGAIPSLNAVILGLRDASSPSLLPVHAWTKASIFFEEIDEVRGDIAIVASDDEGEEMDLDVEECLRLVRSKSFPLRCEK